MFDLDDFLGKPHDLGHLPTDLNFCGCYLWSFWRSTVVSKSQPFRHWLSSVKGQVALVKSPQSLCSIPIEFAFCEEIVVSWSWRFEWGKMCPGNFFASHESCGGCTYGVWHQIWLCTAMHSFTCRRILWIFWINLLIMFDHCKSNHTCTYM